MTPDSKKDTSAVFMTPGPKKTLYSAVFMTPDSKETLVLGSKETLVPYL